MWLLLEENSIRFLCRFMQIKYLKSKPGTAMVQMGDPVAVERAISNLTGAQFFDEKLSLA